MLAPSNHKLRRGDVIRVRLNPAVGSEQGGERPVLVLSPDVVNQHSPVIVVAAITSKRTERIYPFEALIEAAEGGMPQRSKVMLLHVRSIDKVRVTGYYGHLSAQVMERVDEALKVAVGLADV